MTATDAPTATASQVASDMLAQQPAPGGATALWLPTSVSALLVTAMLTWAAMPLTAGKAGTRAALITGIITGVLSIGQLAVSQVRRLTNEGLSPWYERAAERLLRFIRLAPWAEGMLLAILALEALHPARPWHTALLGVALLGFLFAVHLGETNAAPSVLRPQLPLIAAGLGLLALAVGAAALPALPAGSASAVARVVAISAAVVAAALAVPVATNSRR